MLAPSTSLPATLAMGTVFAVGCGAMLVLALRVKKQKKPAQGPPPTVLRVYGSMPLGADPDLSPACIKFLAWLRIANIPYEYVPWTEHMMRLAPKGKIPHAWGEMLGDSVMGDSQLMIETLQERGFGKDIDAWLSDEQKAIGTAFRVMCEEGTYWGIVHSRWSHPSQFAITKALYFAPLPAPLRAFVALSARRSILAQLVAQGYGLHASEDVTRLMRAQLHALSLFLGSKRFLLGEQLSSFDASVFGTLAALLQGEWQHDTIDAVKSFPNLVAYTERIRKTLFPELQQLS